jgi:hypothetical protein
MGLRNPRFWIGILISAAALAFAASRVDRGDAARAFRDADYVWLLPGIAAAVASLLCRTLRWRLLLQPVNVRLGRLFGVLTLSYAITALFPLRLGDVARVYLLGGLESRSKVWVLSTMIVERLLDGLMVIAIVLILAPIAPIPDWVWPGLYVLGIGALLAMAVSLLLWRRRRYALLLADRLPKRVTGQLHGAGRSAAEGFAVFRSRRRAAGAVVWSVLAWLCGGCMMWALLPAFDLPNTATVAFFLLGMSAISMVIPSAPGFVGVYHAFIIETLVSVFDAPAGPAASYAVLTHLLLFVPNVLFGFGYLLKERTVWDQLLTFRRGGVARAEPVPAHERPESRV